MLLVLGLLILFQKAHYGLPELWFVNEIVFILLYYSSTNFYMVIFLITALRVPVVDLINRIGGL